MKRPERVKLKIFILSIITAGKSGCGNRHFLPSEIKQTSIDHKACCSGVRVKVGFWSSLIACLKGSCVDVTPQRWFSVMALRGLNSTHIHTTTQRIRETNKLCHDKRTKGPRKDTETKRPALLKTYKPPLDTRLRSDTCKTHPAC